MALDFLSVPCTSCECEHAFSSAKRTITIDRNLLAPATIEALQKNWLRRRVVKSYLLQLQDYIQRTEKREDKQASRETSDEP